MLEDFLISALDGQFQTRSALSSVTFTSIKSGDWVGQTVGPDVIK